MSKHNTRRGFLKASIAGGVVSSITGYAGRGRDGGSGDNDDIDVVGESGEKVTPEPSEQDNYEPFDQPFTWIGIARDTSTTRFTAQNLAKDKWEQLGLQFDLQPMKLPPLFERWTSSDFDVLTLWWVARPSRLDPFFMLFFNFHSQFTEDGENMEQYVNPQYDEVAERVKATFDTEKRKEAVFQAQEILARDQPGPFYWHINSLAAANTQLFSNWTEQIGTQVYWNLSNLSSIEPNGDTNTVVWASTRSPTAFNPLAVQGNAAAQATKMVYERLVRWTSKGTAEPWAAEEITVVDDTTLEVRLKDGLAFHDGEPFTAEDIAFSFDFYNQFSVPYLAAFYQPVTGVDVEDELTAIINLDEPNAAFRNVHLSQLNMLPRHIWEGITDEQDVEHPKDLRDPDFTGSGPFELARFESGSRIVYETNDDYQLADISFDTLVWNIFGSQASAVGALENDQAAFVQEIQPSSYERIQGRSNIKAVANPSHGTSNFWVHNEREPFNDVAFRQALTFALDKEDMINVAVQGRADPAVSPIAPANEFWYNPDLPSFDGGVDHAIDLLEEAGYRWNDDGELLKPIDRFSGDGPPTVGSECDLELGHCYEVETGS